MKGNLGFLGGINLLPVFESLFLRVVRFLRVIA